MKYCHLLAALAFAVIAATPAQAVVRLPKLVTDHMVLQRDTPLPLWGWAGTGEKVSVTFRNKTYTVTPGVNGKWIITLLPQAAGGPFELVVKGRNTITLRDVLVGDVWLASGQSNMEWALANAQNGPAEAAAANFPQIRLLNVPNNTAYRPLSDVGGIGWQLCTPGTAAEFSAVAYFFGRELHRRYHIPVGLIASEWGGTPAESWTSAAGLEAFPEFLGQLEKAERSDYDARYAAWLKTSAVVVEGHRPGQQAWFDPAYNASAWATIPLPRLWEETEELRDYDGIVWFRKEFILTREQTRQDLTLQLPAVDDADSTWVNGTLVGSTVGYNVLRRYTVPAAALRPGRNVVAVRVVDTGGGGGIWGKPEELRAEVGGQTLPLTGPWQYRLAVDATTMLRNPFPGGENTVPSTLYNAMIAPLVPYALKGVIWYQGESNADRAAQYCHLFPALITDWRRQWQQPKLPFLFVQLASYQQDQPQPANYPWADLREAQAKTLALPGTGMAVTIDIGDSLDIHPRNKLDVGKRLALQARRVAYADNTVVASGPTFSKMAIEGSRVRLTFQSMGGGLVLKNPGGPILKSFAIAGADQKFVWAQGKLEGNTLVLSSPEVPKPVAVRYAWSNSPFANLYNQNGLPAAPFRTDSWPVAP